MDKDETELQDSPEPEQDEEEEESESEILKKNRQLFERAKKAEEKAKELELKIQSLEEAPDDDEEVSEKTTSELKELRRKLTEMEEKRDLDTLYAEFPVLNQKLDEFDEYRQENPGMPLKTAAKAFLAEKDLLGQTRQNPGLEPARGGVKTPPSSGKMSADDVKHLRENNFKEYRRLVSEGKIEFD